MQTCNVDIGNFVDPGVYASEHDGSSQDVYHSILSDLPIPNISVPGKSLPLLTLLCIAYPLHVINQTEWIC